MYTTQYTRQQTDDEDYILHAFMLMTMTVIAVEKG